MNHFKSKADAGLVKINTCLRGLIVRFITSRPHLLEQSHSTQGGPLNQVHEAEEQGSEQLITRNFQSKPTEETEPWKNFNIAARRGSCFQVKPKALWSIFRLSGCLYFHVVSHAQGTALRAPYLASKYYLLGCERHKCKAAVHVLRFSSLFWA